MKMFFSAALASLFSLAPQASFAGVSVIVNGVSYSCSPGNGGNAHCECLKENMNSSHFHVYLISGPHREIVHSYAGTSLVDCLKTLRNVAVCK
jgi:hypothetical protein